MRQVDIKHLLSEPGRRWNAKTGATEAEISALIARARVMLPVEYLDLLRHSNGGEGPLDLPPLWFALYSSLECIELFHSDQHLLTDSRVPVLRKQRRFGNDWVDLGTALPWRIVMVDAIKGTARFSEIGVCQCSPGQSVRQVELRQNRVFRRDGPSFMSLKWINQGNRNN